MPIHFVINVIDVNTYMQLNTLACTWANDKRNLPAIQCSRISMHVRRQQQYACNVNGIFMGQDCIRCGNVVSMIEWIRHTELFSLSCSLPNKSQLNVLESTQFSQAAQQQQREQHGTANETNIIKTAEYFANTYFA